MSVSILLIATNIFLQFEAFRIFKCYLVDPSDPYSLSIENPELNSFFYPETIRIAKLEIRTLFTINEAYF